MLDLKAALASGLSKEDIMAQLEAAEAELKAEVDKDKELDEVREEVIVAVAEYLLATGILPPETEISAEMMEDLKETLKDAEKEIKSKLTALSFLSIFDKKPTTQLGPGVLKITPVKESTFTSTGEFDFEAWLNTKKES